LTAEQGLINHYYTTDSTQLQKMSDADTKSSLGSETGSAEKERLRCMQRIMVEQQQHLLSQYQNKKNSTSGQNGKCSVVLPGTELRCVVFVVVVFFLCKVDRASDVSLFFGRPLVSQPFDIVCFAFFVN